MQHWIVCGETASSEERLASEDLRADLALVTDETVHLVTPEALHPALEDAVYHVGTPLSHPWIAEQAAKGTLSVSAAYPGPQGGIMQRLGIAPHTFVLAGSDPKGVQRVVYAFSHNVLGVDPFSWWTGYKPVRRPGFVPAELERVIAPPAVPTLCYFDNDNDELANMTRPYLQFDLATWKAVIDSLVRIGYNAIDLHDHLGRSEFYRWQFYRQLRPDYHCDLNLLEDVIEYAHAKGVKIQIPMYLAWEFKHISDEEANCWTTHKQKWKDTWAYYLKETPIGQADLFLDRPRSQLWDEPYLSSCDEDVPTVMTEAFTALRDVVLDYNGRAQLICDLYTHGQAVWYSGRFNPPKEYIMLWPNDAFGGYKNFPADKRGYRFGTYMHAGYWLNHTVQDPYPERIGQSMKELVLEHGADAYCLVNGQNFRPFMLNLEAYARATSTPAQYDGASFYDEWATRYFGAQAAPHAVEALKRLHGVSENGYIDLFRSELMPALEACQCRLVVSNLDGLRAKRQHLAHRLHGLQAALSAATKADEVAQDQEGFCHDYVVLPIRLFSETLELALALHDAVVAWNEFKQLADNAAIVRANAAIANARNLLATHLKTREAGDRNPKWKTWYDPKKRRPNGGFPTREVLEGIVFKATDEQRPPLPRREEG
jgi:hypothetical protein